MLGEQITAEQSIKVYRQGEWSSLYWQ